MDVMPLSTCMLGDFIFLYFTYSRYKKSCLVEAVLDLETELKNQSELAASKLAQMVTSSHDFF